MRAFALSSPKECDGKFFRWFNTFSLPLHDCSAASGKGAVRKESVVGLAQILVDSHLLSNYVQKAKRTNVHQNRSVLM